ncbi:MAG TPA: hypothetical protein VFP43_15340 [Mesorhizobium sp.]|nr:hypothetical protein [Mesorhizobium sp.]
MKSGRLFFWQNSDQSQQADKTGCNLRAMIGACRPLAWMQESSSVAATSPELWEKICTKWKQVIEGKRVFDLNNERAIVISGRRLLISADYFRQLVAV